MKQSEDFANPKFGFNTVNQFFFCLVHSWWFEEHEAI